MTCNGEIEFIQNGSSVIHTGLDILNIPMKEQQKEG